MLFPLDILNVAKCINLASYNWSRHHDHWDACLIKELSIWACLTSYWCRSMTDGGPFVAVMTTGELLGQRVPPLPWVLGLRQSGKTNARWSETQGHTLGVTCVKWYQASIFFHLNDKPNCDPFNTRTDNLKDIHLGRPFIYEQEPENSQLTPGGIARWLSWMRAAMVLENQQCPLVWKIREPDEYCFQKHLFGDFTQEGCANEAPP